MSTSAQTFLIAGCDDIGTRLGLQPAAQGWNVDALHRHTTALPPPLVAIRADLTDPARVRARPGDADFVLYPATAARVDEQHDRTACVDGVRNVLLASPSPNFFSSPAARSTASGWWKPFCQTIRTDADFQQVAAGARETADAWLSFRDGMYQSVFAAHPADSMN